MSPTVGQDEASGNRAHGIGALRIGQVARHAGLGVETLRFYERQGLVEEPPRTKAGYRQYTWEIVARLRFIQRAKALGFSLAEIKELISLRLGSPADAGEVRSRAQGKIDEIEAKISDLERMKGALVELVDACGGTVKADDCPILTALEGEER